MDSFFEIFLYYQLDVWKKSLRLEVLCAWALTGCSLVFKIPARCHGVGYFDWFFKAILA
jgi:hypothetical protein